MTTAVKGLMTEACFVLVRRKDRGNMEEGMEVIGGERERDGGKNT